MSLSLPSQIHCPLSPRIAIFQRTDTINANAHLIATDASILHEGKRHTTFRATLTRKGQKDGEEERGVKNGVRWWNPYYRPRQVVCKIATTPWAIELLQNEASVYHQLKKLQGKCIPLFHGLFEGFMQGMPAACIVLDYCGVPLKVTLDRVNKNLLKKVVDAAMAVHKAGIMHRDLVERNIVILDGRPFIIDFESAIPHECLAPKIFIGGPRPYKFEFKCDELYWFCGDEVADLWSPGRVYYFEQPVPIKYALESAEKLAEQAPKDTPEELALLEAKVAMCQLARDLEGYWKKYDSRLPLSKCF
ncbi:hypothetical protein BOTBODRAFT_28580 [Botryobasidium botryosum FD-172 SS1]|uniref:non-specific serine/threonine protein kinase n=1 Tax=Botryobasidium botryosum (strain FD-172 SS1) TaxID=930990 RepID=A0A067MTL0_BOTB1|nr:hypothetical protein BOTBODRAFT_28580 [Botryobasidium botryosum FD-172 SS1]